MGTSEIPSDFFENLCFKKSTTRNFRNRFQKRFRNVVHRKGKTIERHFSFSMVCEKLKKKDNRSGTEQNVEKHCTITKHSPIINRRSEERRVGKESRSERRTKQ